MLMSEEVEVLTPAPRNVAVLRERWGPLCPPPPRDTPSLTSRRSRIRRKEKPSLPVLEGASASRLSPSWPLGLVEPVLAPPGRSPLSKPGASPLASATLSDPLSPHTQPPTLPFPVSLSPAPERLDCVSSASVCGGRGGGGASASFPNTGHVPLASLRLGPAESRAAPSSRLPAMPSPRPAHPNCERRNVSCRANWR